jgi:hypothetical protein
MAKETVLKCDNPVCGRIKRDGEVWFLLVKKLPEIYFGGLRASFLVAEFDKDPMEESSDIYCSKHCLITQI